MRITLFCLAGSSLLLGACNPVDDPGGFSTMITLIVVGSIVVSLLPFLFIMKKLRAKQKLLTTGLKATAKVLNVVPTGMSINGQPQMMIELEVHPPKGRPPYPATTKQVLGPMDLMIVTPGSEVLVRVQKENKANVAVDVATTRAERMASGQAVATPMVGGQPVIVVNPQVNVQAPAAPAQPAPNHVCGYCSVQYPVGTPKCPNCGAPAPVPPA